MMVKVIIILLTCFLFFRQHSFGQSDKKRELGIRIGYGIYNQVLPDKDYYKPAVILPFYNYYLSKREKRSKFSLYVEPQFTFVIAEYHQNPKHYFEYEVGINGGLTYSYWLNK